MALFLKVCVDTFIYIYFTIQSDLKKTIQKIINNLINENMLP